MPTSTFSISFQREVRGEAFLMTLNQGSPLLRKKEEKTLVCFQVFARKKHLFILNKDPGSFCSFCFFFTPLHSRPVEHDARYFIFQRRNHKNRSFPGHLDGERIHEVTTSRSLRWRISSWSKVSTVIAMEEDSWSRPFPVIQMEKEFMKSPLPDDWEGEGIVK